MANYGRRFKGIVSKKRKEFLETHPQKDYFIFIRSNRCYKWYVKNKLIKLRTHENFRKDL